MSDTDEIDPNPIDGIFKDLPKHYDEYLQYYKLTDWPEHLASERILNMREELRDFDRLDIISDILEKELDINFERIDELEELRQNGEFELLRVANTILDVEKLLLNCDIPKETCVRLPEKLERVAEKIRDKSVRVKLYHSMNKVSETTMKDISKRSVENYPYEEYRDEEFTALPTLADPRYACRTVLKNIRISKKCRSNMNKFMSSEASVAVIVDTFWWIFLDYFRDEDFENEKEKYFSRIALDFGILLISATEDIKETFLKIFPEFLAMVLYSLYFKAFPDSRKSFGPEFKQKLVNISHMWLTGLAPLPNSFQSWPMEVLENSKEDSTENLGSTDKTSTKTIKPQTGMLSNFVYTKSLFDPKGCSPLIHRFLQLHDIEPVRTERGRCVTHTDVTEQRSKAASEALANRARRREQFEEVARRQDEEILQLAGERRRLEARFERLQRQLGDLDDTSVMDMRLLVAEYAREGLEEQEPDDGT